MNYEIKCVGSDLRPTSESVLSSLRRNEKEKKRRQTCAGGGVAFTQFLRQLGHLAAYWFVAAHESIFRDGIVLGGAERPVIILLKESEGGDGQ